jgi:hypothetical protein
MIFHSGVPRIEAVSWLRMRRQGRAMPSEKMVKVAGSVQPINSRGSVTSSH